MAKKRAKADAAPSTRATVLAPDKWAGWPAEWGTAWGLSATLTEKVAIVYTCVERISSALASMPLQVSRDGTPGQDAPGWLKNPQPDTYTHIGDAVTEIVWSLLMRGNAYIFVTAETPGMESSSLVRPEEWVVLNPDKVRWDGERRLWLNADTGEPFPRGRMLHIKHQSRPGHRLGVAPLDAAAINLAAVADYERVASKIARNSGVPTQGMLHTDQEIGETTATRYKEKWQTRGDGEIAVLGSGLRYESLTLNPRDLALLELREFDGRQISAAFGVPPFMVNLGMAGDLTYATTQGMFDFFNRQTVRPISYNIGRSLGTMLPSNATTVIFNSDSYTRGSQTEHMGMLSQGVDSGILDVNEARATIGYPPISVVEQQQPQRVPA